MHIDRQEEFALEELQWLHGELDRCDRDALRSVFEEMRAGLFQPSLTAEPLLCVPPGSRAAMIRPLSDKDRMGCLLAAYRTARMGYRWLALASQKGATSEGNAVPLSMALMQAAAAAEELIANPPSVWPCDE